MLLQTGKPQCFASASISSGNTTKFYSKLFFLSRPQLDSVTTAWACSKNRQTDRQTDRLMPASYRKVWVTEVSMRSIVGVREGQWNNDRSFELTTHFNQLLCFHQGAAPQRFKHQQVWDMIWTNPQSFPNKAWWVHYCIEEVSFSRWKRSSEALSPHAGPLNNVELKRSVFVNAL